MNRPKDLYVPLTIMFLESVIQNNGSCKQQSCISNCVYTDICTEIMKVNKYIAPQDIVKWCKNLLLEITLEKEVLNG